MNYAITEREYPDVIINSEQLQQEGRVFGDCGVSNPSWVDYESSNDGTSYPQKKRSSTRAKAMRNIDHSLSSIHVSSGDVHSFGLVPGPSSYNDLPQPHPTADLFRPIEQIEDDFSGSFGATYVPSQIGGFEYYPENDFNSANTPTPPSWYGGVPREGELPNYESLAPPPDGVAWGHSLMPSGPMFSQSMDGNLDLSQSEHQVLPFTHMHPPEPSPVPPEDPGKVKDHKLEPMTSTKQDEDKDQSHKLMPLNQKPDLIRIAFDSALESNGYNSGPVNSEDPEKASTSK